MACPNTLTSFASSVDQWTI